MVNSCRIAVFGCVCARRAPGRKRRSETKSLGRKLGFLDVFAICTGAMISSGFFLLPGIASAKVGPAVVLAYLLSGLMLLPSLLSKAELATAMPRAGGSYFFISRSLGTLFGTIDGIGVWLTLMLKFSVAALGLGAYLSVYLGLPEKLIAAVSCLVFMGLNVRGARETSVAQIAMVLVLLAILVVFLAVGVPAIEGAKFRPFFPFGADALLPAVGLVFVSYIGVSKAASVAEEVRHPERNLPWGMLVSLAVVMVVYAGGVAVTVSVVPSKELYVSLTPLADAARVLLGPKGALLLSAGAVLAFATTANAGLLSSGRYLLAMARDHVIPHSLARLSRRHTPVRAVVFTGLLSLAIILVVDIEGIAKLAGTFLLLEFALVNLGVIVMRESGIRSYDPGFRSPLYPYMQIAGILVSMVIIPQIGLFSTILAFGLVVLGIAWHNLYVRHRVAVPGAVAEAMARVAERLLERDAHSLGLDQELRQVIKERGLRSGDPFLGILNDADFLDLEPGTDPETVLKLGSAILARRSSAPNDVILEALLKRNSVGETPAEAGIALPHVLLEEVDGYFLVAARSSEGVEFPGVAEPVYAIFLLLGSRKDPGQHLRMLAELARLAEEPGFLSRWLAGSPDQGLAAMLVGDFDSRRMAGSR